MVNVKQKGNRGEREVAKILTFLTGTEWKRVPCSGAMFTTGTEEDFKGDVYSKHPDFDSVVVEVKNYAQPTLINDLFNDKSNLNQWIDQLRLECGKNPGILFFKSKGKWHWWKNIKFGVGQDIILMRNLKKNSKTYHNLGRLEVKVK